VSSCPSCAAALAPGQRYCVACGEPCAPLAPPLSPPVATGTEPEPTAATRRHPTLNAPAAAVAVMAILGFGVIVGSVVSPPAESAAAPAIVAVSPPAPAPAPVAAPTSPPAKPAPAAAPAPSRQQTITQTVPAAPPPAPAPIVPAPAGPQLPAVKHVFMIVLPGHGYDDAFGPNSQAPYLATTLSKQGELLTNYYAVTAGDLANQIALVSGQGPNPDTAAGCPTPGDVTPGTSSTDPQQKGQVLGTGCVFPRSTLTLADELVANGDTWKAYVEPPPPTPDAAPPAPCSTDGADPFVYFHSVVDLPTCAQNVAGTDQLATDLAAADQMPTLSYIVSRATDLPGIDAFLQEIVPKITASAAYKDGGLIAITFATGADTSACCAEPTYPNMPPPSAPPADPSTPAAPLPPGADSSTGGGGRVGLLLISSFVKAGSTNSISNFNHYSLLRSIEDLFGLQPTGYAGFAGVLAFDSVIYNAPAKSS
jgi:hypothetical protein